MAKAIFMDLVIKVIYMSATTFFISGVFPNGIFANIKTNYPLFSWYIFLHRVSIEDAPAIQMKIQNFIDKYGI